MTPEALRQEIARFRLQWRETRARRLELKRNLLAGGLDIHAVRKDRGYRILKKEQRKLFVLIRQRERKLNRMTGLRRDE